MDMDTFEDAIDGAMSEIPSELKKYIDNVRIIIQDFPDPETLEFFGIDSPYGLLGLYSGIPTKERSFFSPGGTLPNQIYLYRIPILRLAGPTKPAQEIIKETLLHEIGHHFGFEEEELRALEEEGI